MSTPVKQESSGQKQKLAPGTSQTDIDFGVKRPGECEMGEVYYGRFFGFPWPLYSLSCWLCPSVVQSVAVAEPAGAVWLSWIHAACGTISRGLYYHKTMSENPDRTPSWRKREEKFYYAFSVVLGLLTLFGIINYFVQ
jgi:hypothetical protein